MKKFNFYILFILCFGFFTKVNSQCVNMYSGTPVLGLYTGAGSSVASWSLACNAATHYIWPNQPGSGSNQYNTPCIRLRINPTNNAVSVNNSITLYENGSLVGCTGPIGTCTANIGPMPNTSNYQLFASYMNPTFNHQYVLCNVNSSTPNMTYTISSCYDNTALTTGTWTTNTVGCQTVTIPANSIIGSTTISIVPSVVGAITNYFDGSAAITPSVIPPGTYTINYVMNTGNASCPLSTASRTIVIGNPYNAAWTTPTVQCTAFGCLNLPPQVSGTAGGVFSGTGVSSNSFCPGVTGAGSFPITYSVGINSTCGASQVRTITVNTTPSANAGSTKTLNCIQTTTVLNGSGGTTYTWTGPGAFSSNLQNPTVGSPGTYSLTVTSGSCISAQTTVAVNQNTTQPSSTAATSGSVTCSTNTINLNGGPAGMNYTWTAPGGSSISSGTNSQNAIGQGSGVYTVNVQDPNNGCSRTATVAAIINTVQPNPTASTGGSVTCTSNTINLSTNLAGMNYTWTAPGGSSISSGTNSQNAVGQGSGVYTVNVQDPTNGCSRTATVAANVNTVQPNPTASTGGSVTCATNTITLSTNLAGMNYTWTAPGSGTVTSGANSQNANAQGTGVYTVNVQNPVNGCSRTATVAAVINTIAPTPVSASTAGTVTCGSQAINLSATGPASSSYSWTAPAGSSITSGATSQNATANGSGTYSVLIISSINGCSTQTTVVANTNITPPVPSISPTPTITCTNTLVVLTGNPGTGVLYSWSGSGIIGASNQQTVSVNQVGNYTLVATSTANSCTASVVASVANNTIAPTITPVATQTITCASPSVTLVGSANPSSCTVVWTGGVCAGANSYTATACAPGTYTYIATNPANGCPSAAQVASVVPNSSIPSATLVNTGTITCSTTTVQVTATSTASPVSYSWSGPGVVSGATTPTVTVNAGGTYSLVLLNTSNSCSVMITNSVTADNSPVTPTTTASNTITCNTTTVNLTTNAGSGSYSYNWGGPAIVGTNTLSTATASLGGVYTVTVTNTVNGCTGTGTVSVASNTTVPTGVAITPATFTLSCATPTTILTATATGATSYTWIAPAGGSITSGTNTASAGISGSGTYSVIVAGSNGCPAAAAEATISPNNNAPTFTLSNTAPSITCFSTTPSVSVTITSSVAITSYSWSPTSGIQGSTTTSVVTFTAAGTYTGVITASNGCISNAIVSVADNTTLPNVVAGTATAQAISCLNPSVVIAPTFTPSSGLTYTWSGPGVVGSVNDASVTVNQNGTYSLSVTNTLTGCASTLITIPVVGTTNPPLLNVTSSSSIGIGCLPGTSTVVLSANATPSTGVTYLWSNLAITPTISVSSANVYSVIVTDISTSCSVAVQYTVDNNTALPNVNAGANAAIPCGSTTSTLTLNGSSTSTNVAFSWAGPGIVSGANTPTPIVNQTGTYTLVVTNTVTGCTASGTVNVANGTPTASFTPDVTQGPLPLAVTFTNQSSGASNFSWVINGAYSSPSATTFNFNNTFTSAGSQTVTLIAYNGTCSDSMSVVIIVDEGFSIEIPNVFTPNNDGVNDHFTIKSTGVKEITLEIYNRWGQKMYEFSGAKAAWDGVTGAGNNASDGTYFYFIKATGYDGKTYEKQGSVSLFR